MAVRVAVLEALTQMTLGSMQQDLRLSRQGMKQQIALETQGAEQPAFTIVTSSADIRGDIGSMLRLPALIAHVAHWV